MLFDAASYRQDILPLVHRFILVIGLAGLYRSV